MIKLRPYQEEGLQALWSYFMTNNGHPVLAWPTGTGKSLVPAEFIRRTMLHYPRQRFLMVTHVSKLIEQNHEKMLSIWPQAPIGVYSAGLKSRDILHPIVYGGVQSMAKIPAAFGHRDIMFIDEAHLLSQDDASMYHKLINALKSINPYLKIVGLSATPYRIGQGMIIDGGLFTDICHDLTSMEAFNQLVSDGYLAPLIPKKTATEFDVSNVGTAKGEFILGQLQHEVDKAEITWKALQELVYYGKNRRSWLIYATGIEHANHIAEMLNQMGIQCASVHSKQTDEYNKSALQAHKEVKLKAIVSYSKLTTGLDHPEVDLIGCMRPTMSVSLWVQMLGRGTRPVYAEGFDLDDNSGRFMAMAAGPKQNCLVLDFAKNVQRLGPINDPVIPRKKGDKAGDIPIKLCEACGVYNHISARFCCACNTPFSFEVKFKAVSATEELIRQEPKDLVPVIETFDVTYVIYNKKQKEGKDPYIKATYFCGVKGFDEYVFPNGTKFRHRYKDWWRQRSAIEPPANTEECMQSISSLRAPKRIRVHMNRMLGNREVPEVLSAEW